MLLVLSGCLNTPPSPDIILPVEQTDSSPVTTNRKADSLREAIEQAGGNISESIEAGVSIAVISITDADPFEGEYALEELTMLLVNAKKFRIVDRRNLDIIREEQQLQLSGDVDDETAVSIGHLTGAAFVITGSVSLWESEKYFRLKVLDVQTGQIRTMISIVYGANL